MRFVLVVYGDPGAWVHPMFLRSGRPAADGGEDRPPPDESLLHELAESGELIDATALADPINTTTLQTKDAAGGPHLVEGSVESGGRYVAGFFVVDCESRARAVEIGRSLPVAGSQAVEIRPVLGLSGWEM